MTKKKKTQAAVTEAEAEQLQVHIDSLDDNISELSPSEMEEVVRIIKGHSSEAMELRKLRKKVRYDLYRLRTESEGKYSAHHVSPAFRELFESQPEFKGWRFFGALWDVSLVNPHKVVARDHTEQEEWSAIVAAKFPQLTAEGGIVYPDIEVREKVEAAAAKLAKAPEATGE